MTSDQHHHQQEVEGASSSRSSSLMSNDTVASLWEDDHHPGMMMMMDGDGTTNGGVDHQQLFFVTSYSDFDKLAHGPRGTEATYPISVYRFNPSDGSLVLLNVLRGNGSASENIVSNPAFSRHHPSLNVVYTCTEDIEKNGIVLAYGIGPNGELTPLSKTEGEDDDKGIVIHRNSGNSGHDGVGVGVGVGVDAGGTSTCYLTIDMDRRNLLCVNYWDSTLAVIPLCPTTGALLGPVQHMYDPKGGVGVNATGRCKGGVNHSHNDVNTIRMRQADPHSHALVLDPYYGCIAYVPDLGKDVVREFYYNRCIGKIECELNVLPSGMNMNMNMMNNNNINNGQHNQHHHQQQPHGPRYFEFHPKYNVAYVVNELSSTISVFEVDRSLLREMATASSTSTSSSSSSFDPNIYKGRSSLRLIQSIKTIPCAFPTELNTCGRICVHKSGRFVLVSNRGHQSIAVFRVQHNHTNSNNNSKSRKHHHIHRRRHRAGELSMRAVGYFHTRGETPRHFQFDASGQYLLVANQDSDTIAVFNFNLGTGEIRYTGNEYRVPSPNFICCCSIHDDEDDGEDDDDGGLVRRGSVDNRVQDVTRAKTTTTTPAIITSQQPSLAISSSATSTDVEDDCSGALSDSSDSSSSSSAAAAARMVHNLRRGGGGSRVKLVGGGGGVGDGHANSIHTTTAHDDRVNVSGVNVAVGNNVNNNSIIDNNSMNTTTNNNDNDIDKRALEIELAHARMEIASLKKQLMSMKNE